MGKEGGKEEMLAGGRGEDGGRPQADDELRGLRGAGCNRRDERRKESEIENEKKE